MLKQCHPWYSYNHHFNVEPLKTLTIQNRKHSVTMSQKWGGR